MNIAAVFPAVFVILWSTGFVGAKLGLPYTEPATFLLLRFVVVLAILLPLCWLSSARRPSPQGRRTWPPPGCRCRPGTSGTAANRDRRAQRLAASRAGEP